MAARLQADWDLVCRRILDRNVIELAVVLTACQIAADSAPAQAETPARAHIILAIPAEQQEWFAHDHPHRALLDTTIARVLGHRITMRCRPDLTLSATQLGNNRQDPRRSAYHQATRRTTVRLLETLFNADVVAREMFAQDDFKRLTAGPDPDEAEARKPDTSA